MRQSLTTCLGVLAIVFGAIGVGACAVVIVMNWDAFADGDRTHLLEIGLSCMAKIGLLLTGILLLRRSRAAWIALTATLACSTIDSILVYLWYMPPVPSTIPVAGQVGRMIGQKMGLVTGPIFYAGIIIYLLTSKSRGEFSRDPVPPVPSTTAPQRYPLAVGQIWCYSTRPGEEASRIIVCRVELDPRAGQIVHIHVSGIKMANARSPGAFIQEIGHMPYSSQALYACLTKLESSGSILPEFEEGYRDWKAAFDAGKAGVWTAPVSEAISGMESALR
jgi:hypothetical protein